MRSAFLRLTVLGWLPPAGATVIALPMKIAAGSGGPVRAIALVPRQADGGQGPQEEGDSQ